MATAMYFLYALPMLVIWVWYVRSRGKTERQSATIKNEALAAGQREPASLHPVIDSSLCIGCGACVGACPEQPDHQVLGLIDGKAELVGPADCIGHGACRTACPMDAIRLVFGTATRGHEIPILDPNFQTNVPGVFIAGELGGMGLIRNALEQGRQAAEAIAERSVRGNDLLDLVIVGAGPAGFAASLTAMSKRLRFTTLEQESLGGCVFHYPRGKLVMTAPATLPLIGKVHFSQTSKEALLEFWRDVERKTGLEINYNEQVHGIERIPGGFLVRTPKGEYRAQNVLLTIGRRGTPRKLEVPGEELPKVVYRLIDPEQYAGQRVLVVGGGDSAIEAAVSVAESAAHVTLSYRGAAFDRAKARNRERVAAAAQSGRLELRLESQVRRIDVASVTLDERGKARSVDNDSVIVNAGGVLPYDFLKKIGIAVETKYGTA